MKKGKYIVAIGFFIFAFHACKKGNSHFPCNSGTVRDIDGNVYQTVKIGNTTWMKENLKVAHYNNGDPVSQVTDSLVWTNTFLSNSKTEGWCYYNNDAANNTIYGKLYNWYAATDPRQLCPVGWHLPTDSDFAVLDQLYGGDTISGRHLKADTLWSTPNEAVDNSSGFTALPSGGRGYYGSFFRVGTDTWFWTSNSFDEMNAWAPSVNCYNPTNIHFICDKYYGFPVRCIQDSCSGYQ
jgi:uncharacterized protein (TIGR02145 family)